MGKKRKPCSVTECVNKAQRGGVCIRHGAKHKRCSHEGCTSQGRKGGVCVRHGANATYPKCTTEGCNNFAQKGGICIRHGAKHKRCNYKGCANQVVKGGVCIRHGAKQVTEVAKVTQVCCIKDSSKVKQGLVSAMFCVEESPRGVASKGVSEWPDVVHHDTLHIDGGRREGATSSISCNIAASIFDSMQGLEASGRTLSALLGNDGRYLCDYDEEDYSLEEWLGVTA